MIHSLLDMGVDGVVASSGGNGGLRQVLRRLHSAAGHCGPQWVMGEIRARRRLHSGRGEGAVVAALLSACEGVIVNC